MLGGIHYLRRQVSVPVDHRRWHVEAVVFRRAGDMRLGNPGGIKLRVDGTNPLPPGTVEPITLRLQRHGPVSG